MKKLVINSAKRVSYRARCLLNGAMHRLETLPTDANSLDSNPPVFIIGPPRSGSTLLFQVLAHVFEIDYTTNADTRWYGGISFRKKHFPINRDLTKLNFSSIHGVTEGKNSPSECGQYWYQFFPRKPQCVSGAEFSEIRIKRLRRSISRIVSASKFPFFFKNMNCALRLEVIAKACPEAVFIVTHRNEIENGHSLLEVRKRLFEDYNKWWSMEPRGVEVLSRIPPEEQVIEQIREIHLEINRNRNSFGDDRFFDLSYEKLCEDPSKTVRELQAFLAKFLDLSKMNLDNLPSQFEMRDEVRIDKSLYQKMCQYVYQKV